MGGRGSSIGKAGSSYAPEFKTGATYKDIKNDAMYEATKFDTKTNKTTEYGEMIGADVKLLVKGYKYNGLFWERKKGKIGYEIVPIRK